MSKTRGRQPSDGGEVDPYAKYLDLPAGPRPPNLYQLLGIELFCTHPERTRHAARKQFRCIKPFEDHPHLATRETIQDIMTQIATARVILCNTDKKQEYDLALAEEMGIDLEDYLANKMAEPVPECLVRITAGPEMVGSRIELLESKPTTIGSDPHCVITLPSARVSRVQCQIEHRDREWWLRPVSKDHPTLVNDHRIEEFMLDDGDAIDISGYRLRFARLPERPVRDQQPPPLSLIVRKGPSVPSPVFNALPPESILIGHCDTALWQLAGPLMSRHHCRIEPNDQDWEVKDLRSTNGVQVNGEKIESRILQDRDQISFGQFEVLVSLRR